MKIEKTSRKVKITQVIGGRNMGSAEFDVYEDENEIEYIKDLSGYYCKLSDVSVFYTVERVAH